MPTTFRPYIVSDAIAATSFVGMDPEGHFAYHVIDLVDGLHLTAFYTRYEGDGQGNSPYAPQMMLKVLLNTNATGTFSSRGIEKKLQEDVAFRVLGVGNFPSHRTVCEFQRRHLADFKRFFVALVRLAGEMGLARFGILSIDGTKVRANTSKRKAMSYGRMVEEEKHLAAEFKALVGRGGAVEEEDKRYGVDLRGDETPSELKLREDRLKAIVEAKSPAGTGSQSEGRPYKCAHGKPEDKAQNNFADPQRWIMKSSTVVFQQCYNAQVVVEGESQLIVAAAISAIPSYSRRPATP